MPGVGQKANGMKPVFAKEHAQFIENMPQGQKKTWVPPESGWRFHALDTSDWSKVGRLLEDYTHALTRLAVARKFSSPITALTPAQCLVLAMNDASSRLSDIENRQDIKMLHFSDYGLDNAAAWVQHPWTDREREVIRDWSAASKLRIASGALNRLSPSHISHHWVCILTMASDGTFSYHANSPDHALEAKHPDVVPPLVSTTVQPLLILCREYDVFVTTLRRLSQSGVVKIHVSYEQAGRGVQIHLDLDNNNSTDSTNSTTSGGSGSSSNDSNDRLNAAGTAIQYASSSFASTLLREFKGTEKVNACASMEHFKRHVSI